MSQVNPSKPKRLYDADGDFVTAQEQQRTKELAANILKVIKAHGPTSYADINRALGTEHIHLIDDAIGLLVEEVEIYECGFLTKFRERKMREVPKPDKYGANTQIFATRKVDLSYPTEAMKGVL